MLIGLRRSIVKGMRPWEWEKKGQTTTVAILIIAIIFLLLMITLNIRQVAARKTSTAIAADGAAITVASFTGSYAHMLSEQELEGSDSHSKLTFGWLGRAIVIIFAVLTKQWWLVALTAGETFMNYTTVQPSQTDMINRQLRNMPLEASLRERGIMYAFQQTVDDPVMVVDEHDFDEDGITTDLISRFWRYYQFRVIRKTEVLTTISKSQLKAPADTAQSFTTGYVTTDFIPLLAKLEYDYDFDISFWQPGPKNDEVDELCWLTYSDDPDDYTFCRWVEELNRLSNAQLIVLIHEWAHQLIDDEDSWYSLWAAQEERIGGWTEELEEVKPKLETRADDLEAEAEEEEDEDKKEELLAKAKKYQELALQVDEAIMRLGSFEGDIAGLQTNINKIKTEAVTIIPKPKDATTAVYTWKDSLGKHTVEVTVEGKIPYLDTSTKYIFWTTTRLENKSGNITVTVTRTDQPIEEDGVVYGAMQLNLPAKPALWEDPMREDPGSRTITSKAVAHYNYKSSKCTLVSAE